MKIAIFGSSGMARAIVDICDTMGCEEVVFIDRKDGREPISGIDVVAEEKVEKLQKKGFRFSIGIGDNKIRRNIAETFSFLPFVNVVHSSATFGRGSRESLDQSSGNIIMAGARLSGNIRFGDFGLFNFNCVVGHDVRFGNYIHLGPGAIVCGNVDVRDGAFIWTGAMVRNGGGDADRITIGEKAALGMGAAALGDVPAETSVPPNRTYAGTRKP